MIRCTTDDLKKVERVLKHPEIYDVTTDDGAGPVENYDVEIVLSSPHIYFLMPNDDAVFVFIPVNTITYDVHANVLPGSRGEKAIEAAKQAREWMFKYTTCEKIVCYIPTKYQNVYRFAKACGFIKEGLVKKAYKKDGRIYDLFVLGRAKE